MRRSAERKGFPTLLLHVVRFAFLAQSDHKTNAMTDSRKQNSLRGTYASKFCVFLRLCLGRNGFEHLRNETQRELSHSLSHLTRWIIQILLYEIGAGITEGIVWVVGGDPFAGKFALTIHAGIAIVGMVLFFCSHFLDGGEDFIRKIKKIKKIWQDVEQ